MGLQSPAFIRRFTAVFVILCAQSFGTTAHAQQLSAQTGPAAKVDLVGVARSLSMQDPYARSLFLFMRSNPNSLDDQMFYVAFVSYLVSMDIGRDCRNAFANEFERRDFFTRSFDVKPQLQQIIATKTITQRFEASYKVNTGRYDFTNGTLPFGPIQSVGPQLDSSISAYEAQQCANSMLQGTQVDTKSFPWTFRVVDEAASQKQPAFPFGGALQLSDADARVLFEQFGRQLYAIVSYQVLAAADGSHRVQVIATDAELFGLSDNAVVKVKSFSHPTLSQPSYMDIATELTVQSEPLGLDAKVTFEQMGFRAVANGTAQGRGTGVTVGGTYRITGSAAVGGSSFIMRIAAPQLTVNLPGLSSDLNAQRFLTLFGAVDASAATATEAPVKGSAVVLEVPANGELRETNAYPFFGAFKAPSQTDPAAGTTEQESSAQVATPQP